MMRRTLQTNSAHLFAGCVCGTGKKRDAASGDLANKSSLRLTTNRVWKDVSLGDVGKSTCHGHFDITSKVWHHDVPLQPRTNRDFQYSVFATTENIVSVGNVVKVVFVSQHWFEIETS